MLVKHKITGEIWTISETAFNLAEEDDAIVIRSTIDKRDHILTKKDLEKYFEEF